jgi:hypothetical protein
MTLKRRLSKLERALSGSDPAIQQAIRDELDAIVERAERAECPIELEGLHSRMQTLHEQLPPPQPSEPIELPDDPDELERMYAELASDATR